MASSNPLQSFNLAKNTTPILVVLLIVASFIIGSLFTKVSYLEKGGTTALGATAPSQPTQPQAQPQAPAPGQKVNVETGHLPVRGDKNAKVTVIEFSDFQCPFCGRFFNDAEQGIIKDYVNSGKVKFAYRHFPLSSIHPNAFKGASASECANEQEKFWEYHDLLFKNQNEWSSLDNASAVSKFKGYASELGLNTSQFNSCLDSDKYKTNIDKDLSDGTAAGVNGTPATFVNGQLVSGAQPFSAFKTIIDQELSK